MGRLYRRKGKSLDAYTRDSIQAYLKNLQGALVKKDPAEARQISRELEQMAGKWMPKTTFDKTRDFIGGILFALLVAVVIRTMWFELYTIPSGSMRPTLKEEDYLVVSKTDYGINVPLQEKHFYFDEKLVQRGSVVVFNGGDMDIEDADTTYFYLFPGKKQFVKRLIGKPGDTIYFYGGQIYGIDREGREFSDAVKGIEHIPFIRFDGKVETPNGPKNGFFSPAIFHQMNQPVAKLAVNQIGTVGGEMIGSRFRHYSDLWGMKHYAMARLLTQEQVQQIYPKERVEEGILYLELTHHPTLQGAQLIRDEYNRIRPELAHSVSLIPLQKEHLTEIAKHLTTCRFKVKDGMAWRSGWNPKGLEAYLPKLPGVPDGTYEIQEGKAYRLPFPTIPIIGLFTNGVTRELPSNHPLYSQDPTQIQKLYNLGIEFLNQYAPAAKNQKAMPSRYAYFREGDLHLLNAPILKRGDPVLTRFEQREKEKVSVSTSLHPYLPFADQGPPSLEEIRKHGVQVPDRMYLVLGDNHAMSSDSRQFGFVPEDNLKGGVSFLFAPPGERWGRVVQPAQSYGTAPNVTVWTAFFLVMIGSSLYYRRKLREPLKF